MSDVTLPAELEQYASDAIATGRFRDRAELLAAGIGLLRQQDAARAELLESVLAARQEAEREGYLSAEDVAARVRDTIARKAC